MVSQVDAALMQELAPFKYATISFFCGWAGSYVQSYKGRVYEALGFFVGGVTTLSFYNIIDISQVHNKRPMISAFKTQAVVHTLSTFIGLTVGPYIVENNALQDHMFTITNNFYFYLLSYITRAAYQSYLHS